MSLGELRRLFGEYLTTGMKQSMVAVKCRRRVHLWARTTIGAPLQGGASPLQSGVGVGGTARSMAPGVPRC